MEDAIFKDILDNANDVIIITDTKIEEPGPRILYVNEAFTKLTGYTVEEAMAATPRILQGSDTSQIKRDRIKAVLKSFEPIRIEIESYTKSGKVYWLELSIIPIKVDGEYKYFAAIERDITKLIEIQDNLKSLVSRDSLTNLYNHRAFFDKAELIMRQFKRYQTPFVLLLIDIDDFKSINDTKGHLFGDRLLIKIAEGLSSNFRESDVIARYGGDEFALVLPRMELSDVDKIMKKIFSLEVSLSVGITEPKSEDTTIEDIINRADALLYKAKSEGKNTYCIG